MCWRTYLKWMDQSGFEVEEAHASNIVDMFGNIDLLATNVGFDELVSTTITEPNKLLDLTSTYPHNNPNHTRGDHGLFMTIDGLLLLRTDASQWRQIGWQ